MQYFGRDVRFEDLDPPVYNDLVDELNENSAWKIVATRLLEKYPTLQRREWIDDIERRGKAPNSRVSAARLLLDKLSSQQCDVEILCKMLREYKLFDVLYIIEGEEELEITKQPCKNASGKPYQAAIEDQFSITCEATGVPSPRYQWRHGNVDLPDQVSSTLSIEITSFDQEGEYQCIVSQYDRNKKVIHRKYSNCVYLEINPTPVEIIKQPSSRKVKLGESLILSCEAKSHPSPQYQWYKENKKLNGRNCNTLQIKKFRREDKGEYRCYVWNEIDDKYTDEAIVRVDYPPQKAVTKIALLIANRKYENFPEVRLATNDVAAIARDLKEMQFQVICLQNLTRKKMVKIVKMFCQTLLSGVYVVFYFAGHGFKMNCAHMMPSDLPSKFLRVHAFSEEKLLQYLQKQNPALCVVILDMCLMKPPEEDNPEIHDEIPEICESKCNDNLVIAYTTCSYSPSYEIQGAKNGLYVSHLSKHITSKKPVSEVFMEVAQAVRADSMTKKTSDQKPMITTVPAERDRCLTDMVVCPNSLKQQEYLKYLTNLITFDLKTVEITFPKCRVSCSVTVQPLQPYLNVMQLTTSGLDKWDVVFYSSPNDRVELHPTGRDCIVYNLEKATKGELWIQIGHNGIVHDSVCFVYKNCIAQILSAN